MADKQQIGSDQVIESFVGMIKDPDPQNNHARQLFRQLQSSNPGGVSRDQLLKAITSEPSFASRYQLADESKPPEVRPGAGTQKAKDVAFTPVTQQIGNAAGVSDVSAEGAVKRFTEKAPPVVKAAVESTMYGPLPLISHGRFVEGLMRETGKTMDAAQTPAGIATALVAGPIEGVLGKYAPRIAGLMKWIGQKGAGLYSAYKAADSADMALSWAQDPNRTPEGAAKVISAISQTLAALPFTKTGQRAMGLDKESGPLSKADEGIPPAAREARSKLRDLLREMDQYKSSQSLPPEAQARFKQLNSQVSETIKKMGIESEEVGPVREGEKPKEIPAPSKAKSKRPPGGELVRVGPREVARQPEQKVGPPTVRPGYEEPPTPAPRSRQIVGSSASGETIPTPGRIQESIGGPPPVRGAIEEGPSGYVPDPRAQTRVSANEANQIAEKHGVPASAIVDFSSIPNEQLVQEVQRLQVIKRSLLGHEGEITFSIAQDEPKASVTRRVGEAHIQSQMGERPSEGREYPIHKADLVDDLDKYISAITDLLLYARRPSTPPKARVQ